MREDLLVELLAVHALGRQLATEGASTEVWRRYRVWRDDVLAAASQISAAAA